MPYEYSLTYRTKYLFFDESGSADNLDDARLFAIKAMQEAEHHNCSRLLFDERKLEMNLTSHDVYILAEEFSLIVPPAGLRVAALHSAHNKEVGRTFETMLQNRSVNYRSFESEDEAIAWLTT